MKKVLLLGSTGRTGELILTELLKRDYSVHALVRDRQKMKTHSPNLLVFEGMPNDPEKLAEAIAGCDAVITALNISRRSDLPWSPLRTPPTLLSDTMRLLTEECRKRNIKRLITISAWGVAESRRELPSLFRWLVDHSNISAGYRDHLKQEQLLRGSELDCTIIRPVILTNGKRVRPVQESYKGNPRPRLLISRRNLAHFTVDQLDSTKNIGRRPTVFQ